LVKEADWRDQLLLPLLMVGSQLVALAQRHVLLAKLDTLLFL
jgi:hypothetical protein